MSGLLLVLWSAVAVLNVLAALRVWASSRLIGGGFALAALLTALGAWRLELALLLLGTLFTLASPLAYGRLVLKRLTWSHHLVRAGVLLALWSVWLLPR